MNQMNTPEKYDVIVFGAGTAGKVMAWNMAKAGRRTAVVERKYIGGVCPNVACLPSKNVIYSAKVASLVARHREFGILTGPTTIDMAGVYARKREMVDAFVKIHLDKFRVAGDELILGDGTFVAPRTFVSDCAMEESALSPQSVYSSMSELTQPCPILPACSKRTR
jgi:pyruvate/2-oxoglutarate dehydrogenase complex dihydrolipoamide dehydrogenase (E3) component